MLRSRRNEQRGEFFRRTHRRGKDDLKTYGGGEEGRRDVIRYLLAASMYEKCIDRDETFFFCIKMNNDYLYSFACLQISFIQIFSSVEAGQPSGLKA